MTTDIKRGHRHGNKYDEDFIKLDGVHKTYLLGVEGIAALRFKIFLIFCLLYQFVLKCEWKFDILKCCH
ncbi:MAG: hypothetical protein EZS28_023109 [Streblomastix strix]|uniref:Uncharacterized protein n=1 Tax=Streblomastix strix TaxID=222440 RepID=A0A5J4VFX4_9EUKA|nr:MAG: hypothetical protein EZS28_023109 [Streblomastix strix]